MLSLTNRLAGSTLQRNTYFNTKCVTGFVVQYYRSASVKLTPHDVNYDLTFAFNKFFDSIHRF